MAGIDDILKSVPIDQIAAQLGVAPDVARRGVEEGGATILSGLQANAQKPGGSAAIEKALGKHVPQSDTVDLDGVDTADGQKILKHVFGGKEQEVAAKLTEEPQTAGIDFGKLLPMLAPIVMGILAKGQQKQAPATDASGGGFDVGGLIGGLLGGGSGGGQSAGGGIDIGGLLGGLLGGKK